MKFKSEGYDFGQSITVQARTVDSAQIVSARTGGMGRSAESTSSGGGRCLTDGFGVGFGRLGNGSGS